MKKTYIDENGLLIKDKQLKLDKYSQKKVINTYDLARGKD